MSKIVCIIVAINETMYDIMKGARNGEAHMISGGKTCTHILPHQVDGYSIYEADLTSESGRSFHSDAIGIMLLSEQQRQSVADKAINALLGYSEHGEDHPDLFTTKE